MKKQGMSVFIVKDPQSGTSLAKEIIYKNSNNQTVLFLSGGSTPKSLYQFLAKEAKLSLGAAGMVDERYGEPFHRNSNEEMIRESGILDYFQNKNSKFYKILQGNKSLKNTAISYNNVVKKLWRRFSKKIAVMGIGEDGHTAGLPAGIKNSKLKIQNYVTKLSDFPGELKKRITLTFKALSEMDLLIILVFGGNKKQALNLMFKKGLVSEIPARFYTKPDISLKVILITDQKV